MESEMRETVRRWSILIIFSLYSLTSAFQVSSFSIDTNHRLCLKWIEFAILPEIFETYYGVSNTAIRDYNAEASVFQNLFISRKDLVLVKELDVLKTYSRN